MDTRQIGQPSPAGMNPEIGDMDAASDPDHRSDADDDRVLPGRMGGGLIGG